MSSTNNRRRVLEYYINPKKVNVLEFGALNAPLYRPTDGVNIEYIDYLSNDEIKEYKKDEKKFRTDLLVSLNYVVPDLMCSQYVNKKYDLIIANNVINFVPDLMTWLSEIAKLLNDEGVLFLSVPDKRFTFNIARRDTNIVDLLRNQRENLVRPSFYQIMDHFYFHKKIDPKAVWNNSHHDAVSKRRYNLKNAIFLKR